MQIRRATDADLDRIAEIVRLVVPAMQASGNHQWDEHYPNRAAFAADVANGELWVAEVDGQVAAMAAFCREQSPEYATVGWDLNEPALALHRLAVDPAFRGRGVARALTLHAETVARELGIAVLRVDTNTQNQATQKLLPSIGYIYAGEIGLAHRPGLRFCCYEKRLGAS